MATNGNQFNPDDQQQTGQTTQQNNVSQPVNISGSEAASPATGAAGSTPPSQQQPNNPKATSSGRFQNLNSYLKANQNFNQQGGGLAGKLNQNLTSQANDLQKNFAQAKTDYQTSLDNARQRYDSQFVNNTLQNPTNVSADDTNKFTNMRDASYKGPTQLDQNLQPQVQNFSNLAGNTGTEQGRFNLLNNIYNKPSYSSGQQTLDNLFLQSNPDQLAQLQSSRNTANQINNQLGQAQSQAGAQATDATNEANATRESTRNALTGAITGFDTNQQQAVQNALAQRQQQFLQEQAGLNGGGIGSQDAMKFGLINQLGQSQSVPLYNLNMNDYLTQSNFAPTTQNVSSTDDYNRIAALSKLAGNAPLSENATKVMDTYRDPNQAGMFAKQNPYDFNNSLFQHDIGLSKANYDQQTSPLQGQIGAYNADLYGGGTSEGSRYQGGLLGEQQRRSDALRNSLIQTQQDQHITPESAAAAGVPYVDYSKLGASDLLNQYGDKREVQGGDTWLTKGISTDQQEMASRQAALQQLMGALGSGRTLGINDASQYANTYAPPATGTKNTGDIHTPTAGGTDESATRDDQQLNALKSIYNR